MQITQHIYGLYSTQLNLNLEEIKKSCHMIENQIEKRYKETKNRNDDSWIKNTPQSTQKFNNYNLLLCPILEFNNLYTDIQKMFHTCLSNFHEESIVPHRIQCWLNYYKKGQFIDWHSHWPPERKAWHGFFCVQVEPDSYTSYKWKTKSDSVNIKSVNNLLVLGLSNGDMHKSSEWNQEYPRITLAFDIVPLKFWEGDGFIEQTMDHSNFFNHWMPI